MFQEIVFATYLNFGLANNRIHFRMHTQQFFLDHQTQPETVTAGLGTLYSYNETLLYIEEVKNPARQYC